jgi:hypothetical protein
MTDTVGGRQVLTGDPSLTIARSQLTDTSVARAGPTACPFACGDGFATFRQWSRCRKRTRRAENSSSARLQRQQREPTVRSAKWRTMRYLNSSDLKPSIAMGVGSFHVWRNSISALRTRSVGHWQISRRPSPPHHWLRTAMRLSNRRPRACKGGGLHRFKSPQVSK